MTEVFEHSVKRFRPQRFLVSYSSGLESRGFTARLWAPKLLCFVVTRCAKGQLVLWGPAVTWSSRPGLVSLSLSAHTRTFHKDTNFFFNLLLYLQLNQTCLPQSAPVHSRYTAPNVFPSSGTRLATCFAGWREGPLSNFLLSPLPSEIGDLLVRILTSGTRKSPQGPNLHSRAAGVQQSSMRT